MNREIIDLLNNEACFFRGDPDSVNQAFARLEIRPPAGFASFHQRYQGTFGSDYSGFELVDIVGHAEELTMTARRLFGLHKKFVVLSEECGDAVLIYDSESDEMFVVDFEGGCDLLKEGRLRPRWPTFESFLEFYFLGSA